MAQPMDLPGRPVFIQRSEDGLYLKEPNDWVGDRREAQAFSSTAAALEYCQFYGIRDFQLAVPID